MASLVEQFREGDLLLDRLTDAKGINIKQSGLPRPIYRKMIAVTEDGLRVFTDSEEISLGAPLEVPDRHDRDAYQGHDRRDERDQDEESSLSDFPI